MFRELRVNKALVSFFSGVAIVGLTSTVAFAATIANPAGVFLDRVDLAIPANPIASNSFFSAADLDDEEVLGGVSGCDLGDGGEDFHPFVTDTITVSTAGTFTFRIVNSAGVYDPFLALFSGVFDKANPDTGILGCNDDSDYSNGDTFVGAGDGYTYPSYNGLWSEFSATLTPGTYTVMLATWGKYDNDDQWYGQRNGDSGTGSISTATFEYWGPSGGLGSSVTPVSGDSVVTGTPGIFLTVTGGVGSLFEGRTVIYGSYAVAPNSTYRLTIQSITNPWRVTRVLASGLVNGGGHLEATTRLPRMEADNYRIIFEGVAANGQPLKLTNHVNVNESGRFTSISAELLQPTLN
jgi:hypothetical protein